VNCAAHGCPSPAGSACHCAACHQTFSNLTLFDRHQDWRTMPGKLSCVAARELGLVRGPTGTWWTPEGLQASTERAGRLHQARMETAA
jgi:hypothetical protein